VQKLHTFDFVSDRIQILRGIARGVTEETLAEPEKVNGKGQILGLVLASLVAPFVITVTYLAARTGLVGPGLALTS